MKRYFLIALLIPATSIVQSQNLVPNPGFETVSFCPLAYASLCNDIAAPWMCGSMATPDLFNTCAVPFITGIPYNAFGAEHALSGNGYAGILCKFITPNYREYLMVELTQPLVSGAWYDVSFFISLADFGCGTGHMGVYFSQTSPYQSIIYTLNYNAQIDINNGFFSDTSGWTAITGCFQAEGGELYMLIGNFYDEANTPFDPDCTGTSSYYYIDEVSVMEGNEPEEILFDLGGPETACYEYEINPDLSSYYLTWEDGSTGPTLVVTESGTYSLSITDGCNTGVDSIEIIINGNNAPVEIGPETLTLCNGESYTITLDPDVSEYQWSDGSTGPDFTITTGGTYAVTLDDGCETSTDEISIDVLNPPSPFNLGEDMPLCAGDVIEFIFDPSLGDFIWNDGTTNPFFTIEEGGIYSVTISNMCGEATDEIVFDDLETPEINLGSDNELLCIGEILDIELDPLLGDILWQDGSNAANYTISMPGTYTVFVTNTCGTGSDQIIVEYLDEPAINFGPDIQLCSGDSVILDASGVQGNYIWQDNTTDTTFEVTQSGIYTLTVSNACGSAHDSIEVTYGVPILPPNLGPNVSLCPGESIVLSAPSPGANFLWQDSSTADSLVVSSTGIYFVLVYDNCSAYADTILVTVNADPPQVDLPTQISLCQGEDLTLDALITGVNYLWNDASQNQQLVVTSPGTYSVTVSNTCGTDVDTTIVLDGGQSPTVALGTDLDLCPGETLILTPVVSDVNTWLWQDGSTLPSYTVLAPGVVTVAVSNACSSAFDTLVVNALPATPPLSLGADTALCFGQSFVLYIHTPDVNIQWPDESTDSGYTVSGSGAVFASIANACGQSFDTILVSALPEIPALMLGPDQSLCPGEVITISPGLSDVTYTWHDGSTGSSYQSTQQETIILTIANECGSATDSIEVIESTQGPQVDLGNDIQACEGEVVTIPSGISGVNYLWQDGSMNPQYVAAQSGVFILQVSNNCGADADTILVDISGVPPTPDLGADTTLCEGVFLYLQSAADAETSFEWQDGSSIPIFIVNAPGTYTLSESNRCGDASDSIVVSYLSAPHPFTLGMDTTICPGESITLYAPLTPFAIQWNDGSTQQSLLADEAGLYALQISNACGILMDAIVLDVDTRLPILDFDSTIPWCAGDIITLDATQLFQASYAWSTGASGPSIQITTPGVYSVEVSVPCHSTAQHIDIVAADDCEVIEGKNKIYIPNIFSPNGDGINDEFTVTVGPDLDVVSISGSIFDRWGNLVFGSESMAFAWDGKFKGESVQPGAYVYVIKVTNMIDDKEDIQIFSGDVTLIR